MKRQMFDNNLIKKMSTFCAMTSACGPHVRKMRLYKNESLENAFVAKQRQNCYQNISHDTLRAAFVVENQRGRCSPAAARRSLPPPVP